MEMIRASSREEGLKEPEGFNLGRGTEDTLVTQSTRKNSSHFWLDLFGCEAAQNQHNSFGIKL